MTYTVYGATHGCFGSFIEEYDTLTEALKEFDRLVSPHLDNDRLSEWEFEQIHLTKDNQDIKSWYISDEQYDLFDPDRSLRIFADQNMS